MSSEPEADAAPVMTPEDEIDNAPEQGPAPAAQAPPDRNDYRRGLLGATAAVLASGLLILGLWLAAREAPSAATDPRLRGTLSAPAESQPLATTAPIVLIQPTIAP